MRRRERTVNAIDVAEQGVVGRDGRQAPRGLPVVEQK